MYCNLNNAESGHIGLDNVWELTFEKHMTFAKKVSEIPDFQESVHTLISDVVCNFAINFIHDPFKTNLNKYNNA
jgi:hypothetical protein